VLLNACYSQVQAEAIARHIDSVIGMSQPIGDRAAIEFATSFYDALGAGEAVEFAFRLGCNAMQLQGIAEDKTPVLIAKPSQFSEPEASESSPELGSGDARIERTGTAKIFISYKRGVEPDERVALALYEALRLDHSVFIDQTMTVGTRWAERIEAEIRQSDFLVTLLSAHSVQSEMVVGEIVTAHDQAKVAGSRLGKPMILPIRMAYREAFAYPLSAYLNGINWAFWESEADTAGLVEELRRAIAGQPLSIDERAKAALIEAVPIPEVPRPTAAAQPALEMPEGTMDLESQFYVVREQVDAIALDTIGRQGVTITIKGPRQMGKSSLLIRTMAAASAAGKRVAFLDFQLFDKAALGNADLFFRQFCAWLTDELELADRVEEFWSLPLGNSQRCTRYLQRYVLKELGCPLVLAMDEVECVFDTDFRSDFFSMLRSWHNNRATTPIWKQLDLALVTSTEPYQLIENLNQSPFNVGQVIELSDFSAEQVAELVVRHGSLLGGGQGQQFQELLGGHPYLVRRALYLVASGQWTVARLFESAVEDRGPFGDHLRYHLFRMNDKPELMAGMLQVIRQQTCGDERVFFRLRGAGLVRRERQRVVPRCRLYAEYFQEHLHG
jgi:AAA-like domain/TIR domain